MQTTFSEIKSISNTNTNVSEDVDDEKGEDQLGI